MTENSEHSSSSQMFCLQTVRLQKREETRMTYYHGESRLAIKSPKVIIQELFVNKMFLKSNISLRDTWITTSQHGISERKYLNVVDKWRTKGINLSSSRESFRPPSCFLQASSLKYMTYLLNTR